MLTLRPYQEAAKTAVYEHLRNHSTNPCVVIPTAGGKTPIIASICRDAVTCWNGRVLVLAHVKELLEQAAAKLAAVCPEVAVGIYSAGLGRRDMGQKVIVAGIQSVYKRACDLDAFDLVIVDEAHLIPEEGDGMYRQFFADTKIINPKVRVIGFTATPFRMKSGLICGPENILNEVCFEVGVEELIRQNFLCPLVATSSRSQIDTDALHVRGGEFIRGETEALMDGNMLVEQACTEIVERTVNRKSVLIFAAGVKHARHIQEELQDRHGTECGLVCTRTASDERERLLVRFRQGTLKYLVNVNVLTTGFDAPNIDCVAILRPTMSPGLFYQMCGRGFRLYAGKQNCLVLDFGGNISRHGPVDEIHGKEPQSKSQGTVPTKECPQCQSVVAAGYAFCPVCHHMFPPPVRQNHDAEPSTASVLSGEMTDIEYEIRDVLYSVHTKRDASPDEPKTMRVIYRLGLDHWQSEFICFEHSGYARAKAVLWWSRRSRSPVPDTAARAVEIAETGGLAYPETITIRHFNGEKYDCIVGQEVGPIPEQQPADELLVGARETCSE